jgi:hypothetical protein
MMLNAIRFSALLFASLALGPSLAHLLELPNKIGLAADAYLTVQQIYRGWALLGIVAVAALLSSLLLAVKTRAQRKEFVPALCLPVHRSDPGRVLDLYFSCQSTNARLDLPAAALDGAPRPMGILARRQRGPEPGGLACADLVRTGFAQVIPPGGASCPHPLPFRSALIRAARAT